MLDYALREVVSRRDMDHQRRERWRSNWDLPQDMGCLLESDNKSTLIGSSPASLQQNVKLFELGRKNEEATMADPESRALASGNDSAWSTGEPTASDSSLSSDPEIGNSVEAVDEAPYTDDGLEDHMESLTRELVDPDNSPGVDVPFNTELGSGKNNGLCDHNTTASTPDGQSEICQSDAAKLLQEALGKLLQQQEADQSFDSRADADHGTVNERTRNVVDGNDTGEPEKPVSSNRRSRLKKLILLKRFVRAVEKTKKLNPKLRLHHQRPEAHLDAETVSLRHQSIEERKRSKEWMLDYALSQAVSKLDQEQKRRVSLLVETFEKIVVDEERNTLVSKDDGESMEKEHGTDLCPDSTDIPRTVDEPLEAHSEYKRCTKLWYMVHRHMVSGLEAEQGQKNASPDGTDTPRSHRSSPDQDREGDIELEKMEAIRLVQEAIDGILIYEGEEDSINDQSHASNLLGDTVEEKEETESKPEAKFGPEEGDPDQKIRKIPGESEGTGRPEAGGRTRLSKSQGVRLSWQMHAEANQSQLLL
ncbi:hypothetical protein MLD38_025988 [Melastoma candidum]|uniref:Uncharacterized protein n=1 Tax=Melastoma candidum TaxID=119954 RepID=A0ACB9P3X4_9MYRT|nr:hypothetical protein MLD38_025988 [Melastoma candidum]